MQLPQIVEVKSIRVLTTKQIAKEYDTSESVIRTNFSRNRTKFIEGKHYIALIGDELRNFKDDITKCNAVKGNDITKCNTVGTRTNLLYLWTEKGALLHAKSLNTDKAWEVYDYLVDFYFRAKEEAKPQVKAPVVPTVPVAPPVTKVPTETFPEIENPIRVFRELMEMAECRGIKVQSAPLKGYKSMLRDDKIAIKNTLSMNQIIFELAYELSHAVLHEKEGKLTDKVEWEAYHMRAWRAAIMLIEALTIKVA